MLLACLVFVHAMSIVVQGVAWIAHATTSLCEAHARPPCYPAGVMVLSAVHGVTLIAHAWPHRVERIARARQVTLLDSLRKRCDFARARGRRAWACATWACCGAGPRHSGGIQTTGSATTWQLRRAVAEVRALCVLHPW